MMETYLLSLCFCYLAIGLAISYAFYKYETQQPMPLRHPLLYVGIAILWLFIALFILYGRIAD